MSARLTFTFDFGPKLVEMASSSAADIQPLPKFSIDRLQERWNDGDLLLHLGSDDPFTLVHAQRMLIKDARSFCEVKWVQTGFRRSRARKPAER